MTMQDPIADMLTRIRNAQRAQHQFVSMPSSKLKLAICEVLLQEGYIASYEVGQEQQWPVLVIELKYFERKPVIQTLDRISRSGLRIYRSCQKLPQVLGGLGIAIVSTSKGVMSDSKARELGLGGEVLCQVA